MPARRRRGRGYIEELPSGSYRAAVYAGIDSLTGKERYLRETSKTYAAAQVALTRLQGQVDEERHPKAALTLQAIAKWLEVAELEDTTRERYDDLIRLYILPTLGHLQASKVDAELLERLKKRFEEELYYDDQRVAAEYAYVLAVRTPDAGDWTRRAGTQLRRCALRSSSRRGRWTTSHRRA